MENNMNENLENVKQKNLDDLQSHFHPLHLRYFMDRGISPKTIRDYGLRSCAPCEIFSITPPHLVDQVSSAFEIPYPHLGEKISRFKVFGENGEPVTEMVKTLERGVRKKSRKKVKFLQKPGSPHLFITMTAIKVLHDPSIPLYICEGPMKALALEQKTGLPAIAIDGCYCWKRKDDGVERYLFDDQLIKDFLQIAMEGRTFYIPADSDYVTNENVRMGYLHFFVQLLLKWADVYFVPIPSNGEVKQGIDDYLVSHSKDDFLSLSWTKVTSDMLRGIDARLNFFADEVAKVEEDRKVLLREETHVHADLSQPDTISTPLQEHCTELRQKYDPKAICGKVMLIIRRKGKVKVRRYFCRRADCSNCFEYYYKRKWKSEVEGDIPMPYLAILENYQRDWRGFCRAIERERAIFHRFKDTETGRVMVFLDKPVEAKGIRSSDKPLVNDELNKTMDDFITRPNRPLRGSEMHDRSRSLKKKKIEDGREKAQVYLVHCDDMEAVVKKLEKEYNCQYEGTSHGSIILKSSEKVERFLDSVSDRGESTKGEQEGHKLSPCYNQDDAFRHIVELTKNNKRDLNIEDEFDEETQGFRS